MNPVNERYIEIGRDEFPLKCAEYFAGKYFLPDDVRGGRAGSWTGISRSMPSSPRRARTCFEILTLKLKEYNLSYKSITPLVPAAHWYEREMHDMFGIVPEGHPDLRPLCLHGMYGQNVYPLRRDITVDGIKRSTDLLREDNYSYMKMLGQGVYEIPVGPVHAGIIEPGHFRFSAVGETIYHLDPRLFYTHKGTEKLFESRSFDEGVELSERISGVSSFSHSCAYCIAVERMAEIEITPLAKAVRTLLIELERLYNHIGDIGNLCAGTGVAVGYAKGALLKEALMALNNKLTGSRYLRGINAVGGVTRDIFKDADEIISTLDGVKTGFKEFMAFLQDSISHIERMEGAGVLAKDIAVKMGATGSGGEGLRDLGRHKARPPQPHIRQPSIRGEYVPERRRVLQDDGPGGRGGMFFFDNRLSSGAAPRRRPHGARRKISSGEPCAGVRGRAAGLHLLLGNGRKRRASVTGKSALRVILQLAAHVLRHSREYRAGLPAGEQELQPLLLGLRPIGPIC